METSCCGSAVLTVWVLGRTGLICADGVVTRGRAGCGGIQVVGGVSHRCGPTVRFCLIGGEKKLRVFCRFHHEAAAEDQVSRWKTENSIRSEVRI